MKRKMFFCFLVIFVIAVPVSEAQEATILYELSGFENKIPDVLSVKLVAFHDSFRDNPHVNTNPYGDKKEVFRSSLREVFEKALKGDVSKLKILKVERVVDQDRSYKASIWFTYIEKEKFNK